MIRSVLRLVPAGQRSLLAPFLVAVTVFALAQSAAYVLLTPLLTAVFGGDLGAGWAWTGVLGGALVLVGVAGYVQAMLGFRIGIGMLQGVQTTIGDHIGVLPLGWFRGSRAAAVSRVVSTHVRDVMGVFAHLLTPLLVGVIVPLGVAVGMLFVDWRVSVAMLVAAPILWAVNRWSSRVYARADARAHEAADVANARVVEFAQAQPVLRAFGATGRTDTALRRALDMQRRTSRGQVVAAVPGLVVFGLLVQLTFVALVFVAVSLIAGGTISVPAAIALIAVCSRFVDPLLQASEISGAIRAAAQASHRIDDILGEDVLAEGTVEVVAGADIVVSDVSFAYDGGEPVLRGLDFEAPAGTTTAIVGPSGAGKTTILRLLSRYADVTEGAIRVGGVDIRDLRSEAHLRAIAPVLQDTYLFDSSILDNVRVGSREASDEAVGRAVVAARVDEIAARLPDGLDARVGEGGTALSGGERQRVAVARALVKDAPIVLLDETTASLDPVNEAAVVRGIRELTVGKTVVVVAHRLATIRHADQILFVDDGAVVERGTHDGLLALGGRYADFWRERERAVGWRLAAAHPRTREETP